MWKNSPDHDENMWDSLITHDAVGIVYLKEGWE